MELGEGRSGLSTLEHLDRAWEACPTADDARPKSILSVVISPIRGRLCWGLRGILRDVSNWSTLLCISDELSDGRAVYTIGIRGF